MWSYTIEDSGRRCLCVVLRVGWLLCCEKRNIHGATNLRTMRDNCIKKNWTATGFSSWIHTLDAFVSTESVDIQSAEPTASKKMLKTLNSDLMIPNVVKFFKLFFFSSLFFLFKMSSTSSRIEFTIEWTSSKNMKRRYGRD